jgi:hypothetical protein
MTAAASAPVVRTLAPISGAVLESLYQHRVLSTCQLRAMHAPAAGLRWMQRVMAALAAAGLAGFVRVGRGAPRLYHLTAAGADAVELIATRTEPRRRLVTAARAAGPLHAHTREVNDAGIAFMTDARQRGDDCGPLAWRHEIAHPTGPPRPRHAGPAVIADAVLTYLQRTTDNRLAFHYAFVEIDRATQPVDALATKLARYSALHAYTPKGQSEPAWREHHPVFPLVLCLLSGTPSADALRRRERTVLALCAADPKLADNPHVHLRVAHLADLIEYGPFAAIFHAPAEPDLGVDWLGAHR